MSDMTILSDITILKEMINEKATVPLEIQKQGTHLQYSVTLRELKFNYFVTIDGMPPDDQVIIIDPEKFTANREFFTSEKGQGKMADFVIIAETKIEKVILCLEMKKEKDDRKKIIQQLTGAKCLVTYCQEIGQEFWKKHDFLKAYEYRFVSIGRINTNKTKSQIKPKDRPDHDRPEKMLEIFGQRDFQFNQLL